MEAPVKRPRRDDYAEQVVHVPDEAHAAARAHCRERGIRLRDWVSDLALEELARIAGELAGVPVTDHRDHVRARYPQACIQERRR
jgi:hypothetical protein